MINIKGLKNLQIQDHERIIPGSVPQSSILPQGLQPTETSINPFYACEVICLKIIDMPTNK